MQTKRILLVGAPVDSGKTRLGCLMGPDAYRTARLGGALSDLGHEVSDLGNVRPDATDVAPRPGLHELPLTIGWTSALSRAASEAMAQGMPIFMGGDHALSLGTVHGVAAHAAATGRPQFVLWLDAHSDFHTLETTDSGNLHGTPLGYLTGRSGFDSFPPVPHPIPEDQVCIIGLRSVDTAERNMLEKTAIRRHDMRDIDENGIAKLLGGFLDIVAAAGGALHVSLDVDFLDPSVAPAVGTTVPGGATVREAHLVMEMLHDSGLMTSLDLVELNPMLDDRGRTAQLMVDLAASALGRRVFDRPTPRGL
ncbi:arginase [Puniceibacterium sediminis]|uniref:Arginase n=1 Tax=Puniceibacterium sediminis TaxID=1608407 RepID=A0A238X1D1_9RHOB|nr:arginase [Puniceibacterium sediminis]SNR52450.1 arginase [Puniceibacterium sediminis]